MTMPVDAHIAAGFGDDIFDEANQSTNATGRHMTTGVTNANTIRTGLDGCFVERAHMFRLGTGGVLCHEHGRQGFLGAELDGILGKFDHLFDLPALRKHADWRGANERTYFHRCTDLLHHLSRRGNVGDQCSTGHVGGDVQVGHLATEGQDIGASIFAGSRKANIRRVNSKALHQVDQGDLIVEAWVESRGAL